MLVLIQAVLYLVSVLFAATPNARVVSQAPPDAPTEAPSADQPPADAPSDAPSDAPAAIVQLSGDRYRPAMVTVPVGGTVLWINDEDDPFDAHNVISHDYRWASSDFLPGESYRHTFTAPGEYRYFCDLHGGMTGRVVVQ